MHSLIVLVISLATFPLIAAEPLTLRLWPGTPPGDENYQSSKPAQNAGAPNGDDVLRLTLVTEPSLTVYRAAADKANGAGVLVCPGGGYNILAWDKEGTKVAQWLNTIGITAAVLQYRVPRRDPQNPHLAPLKDAQRALRLVRKHSKDWGVDEKRVGILGFSAGGNLAVMAGTQWNAQTYARLDAVDDLSCRPDFLIPIYPAYLGNEDKPGPLSPQVRVTKDTPPTFIVVTQDDKLRGLNSASFYIELQKAGVPAELHIYTKGGHGYGLLPSDNPVSNWPQRCEEWLRAMKIMPAA